MKPTTREELKAFCLRALGAPVIEINVFDEQVEDRIDTALSMYADYHFDASEKIYYKHQVTNKEKPGAANTVVISSGGTLYSNSDTLSISGGSSAEGMITTYANGTIQEILISNPGAGYSNTSTVTINTSTGSGANVSLVVGDGSLSLPQNIMGAVKIFSLTSVTTGAGDMFNINYQIALNDLYSLTSQSMVPYYMTMQHLTLLNELLVGEQQIRFSRHKNKIYIDMDWDKIHQGQYLIIEAYDVIDPEVFTDIWGDRWLQRYCTALIQEQWGRNLTKFTGMALPGGVQFNGERILSDAQNDIAKIEESLISAYSLPPEDFWG